MNVMEALDALRDHVPGCSVAAFTDLSSRLVLCASSAVRTGQEDLDALSQAAALLLDGALAEGAGPVWSEAAPGAAAGTAMLLSDAGIRVAMRSSGKPTEALVCLCAPGTDLDRLVGHGRRALDDIQAEG